MCKGLSGWRTGIRVEDDQGIPVFKYDGWHWIPYIVQGQIWLLLRAGMTLFREYVTQHGLPDIIHAHNAQFAGFIASKIKQEWGIPYVLTEHSSAYARGLIRRSEMVYIKDAFQLAEQRLVVSPTLGHVLEEIIGDSVRPWEWVSNILDRSFKNKALGKETNKDGDNPFRFLHIGSLIELKGQADLLRAFASKFEGKSEIQLRIGGSGPLRQELETLSKNLSIDQQVIFLGQLNREQVLAEMQTCDIYVLSSHYETFGVVLIEALACGKPVIATTCGGPDYIIQPENGVLVPPKDIVRLAEAMAVMKEKIDRYDPIRIRQDCISRFGEQAIIDQLSSIYREVQVTKTSSGINYT